MVKVKVKVGDWCLTPEGAEGRVVWVSEDGRVYGLKAVNPVRHKMIVYLIGVEE